MSAKPSVKPSAEASKPATVLSFKRASLKKKNLQKKAARNEIMKRSVVNYWDANPSAWESVQAYLKQYTLRFVDFFVTSYARSNVCEYPNPIGGGVFNVYHSMQEMLNGLNKEHLDPFKRSGGEGDFEYRGVRTNVAQLTFFRWAHVHGVFEYMAKHREEIDADRHRKEMEHNTDAAHQVVIQLPPCFAAEEAPEDLQRVTETVQECLQRPRKKRKRLRPSRPSAAATLSAATAAVALDKIAGTEDLKGVGNAIGTNTP